MVDVTATNPSQAVGRFKYACQPGETAGLPSVSTFKPEILLGDGAELSVPSTRFAKVQVLDDLG